MIKGMNSHLVVKNDLKCNFSYHMVYMFLLQFSFDESFVVHGNEAENSNVIKIC